MSFVKPQSEAHTTENLMNDLITCPNCGHEIEMHAAASAQMREHLLHDLQDRERTLQQKALSLDADLQSRLSAETVRLRKEIEKTTRTAFSQEVDELREKLESANAAEVLLRKDRRALEEQKRELELAVNRTLDEERETLREQARVQLVEQSRHRDADKDKLITDLKRQIDDMKRTAEFGSQQAQGFTLELELEHELRRHFPMDAIEAVPGGANGGDVLQRVFDRNGSPCGTILWESKRTKTWNDSWLPKLRDDQRRAKSEIAVLLSVELPKSLANFGCIDGIWITNRDCYIGLAAALRHGVIEAARARETAHGKMTKVDLVFQYFAGSEFRQKIEGLVEAFVEMKKDLDSEKRSFCRIWNKREKQIARAMVNTSALYGDLGCIIGPGLTGIPQLELGSIAEAKRPVNRLEDFTESEVASF